MSDEFKEALLDLIEEVIDHDRDRARAGASGTPTVASRTGVTRAMDRMSDAFCAAVDARVQEKLDQLAEQGIQIGDDR